MRSKKKIKKAIKDVKSQEGDSKGEEGTVLRALPTAPEEKRDSATLKKARKKKLKLQKEAHLENLIPEPKRGVAVPKGIEQKAEPEMLGARPAPPKIEKGEPGPFVRPDQLEVDWRPEKGEQPIIGSYEYLQENKLEDMGEMQEVPDFQRHIRVDLPQRKLRKKLLLK